MPTAASTSAAPALREYPYPTGEEKVLFDRFLKMELGHPEAVSAAQDYAIAYPKSPFAWQAVGMTTTLEGKHAEGKTAFAKCAALAPGTSLGADRARMAK